MFRFLYELLIDFPTSFIFDCIPTCARHTRRQIATITLVSESHTTGKMMFQFVCRYELRRAEYLITFFS